MKKLLLTMLGLLLSLPAFARDFEYTYEGQTITYTVIDEEAKTCKTKVGSWSTGNPGNNISGELILPSHPTDGFTDYTLTSIGNSAFLACYGLTSVTIPNSVTSIGKWAFEECRGLETVTLSENLKTLMEGAFSGCYAIKNVNYKGETPIEATKDVFDNSVYENATLYVNEGKISSFQEVSPWMYFKNITDKEYSAVDEVIADEDGIDYALPYSVYNLKGQMAGNSIDGLIPGMYIVRQGSKVKKVVVK
ncbi:MAG: leucine-rich repeat domain-containing protein [Muribaculaceae bacterium]|nr:leucine-rich repeat domain-containing protein [Muribaculaceae bacterium]